MTATATSDPLVIPSDLFDGSQLVMSGIVAGTPLLVFGMSFGFEGGTKTGTDGLGCSFGTLISDRTAFTKSFDSNSRFADSNSRCARAFASHSACN